MASPTDCSFKARVAFAVLGILIGISILATFGSHYRNWNAALWGLASGIAAAATLYVHVGYLKEWWTGNPRPLRHYMLLGCFVQLAGVCGFVTYIVLAITEHQGLVIFGEGYYVASVWCFMTWKWGFQLFFFSRSYWRLLSVGIYEKFRRISQAEEAVTYGSASK